MTLEVINPANGQRIKTFDETPAHEVNDKLAAANATFASWRQVPFDARARLMKRAAGLLRERKVRYAELMALEMGKPITGGIAEAEKCAWVCEYYAEHAQGFLADERVTTEARASYVVHRPLGVVLAVMPWNFPLWQVFRFAAPALMAGNVGILKHASNVPGSALAIQEVFCDAGFPAGAFTTLLIGSAQVEAVINHPVVKAVALTGSTPAGRAVAAQAGKALKKCVLELGGSDPYLILADADIPLAAGACAASRLINSGQSCIAAKRFIVVEAARAEFEAQFVERMKAARMGDPFDPNTEVGPQARTDLRDELHQQVTESLVKGAKLLLGGAVPPGPGAFYPPTVLTDVEAGMPAYDEELFGPVAAVIPVQHEAEAIRVANDTVFGLGSAVFTRNQKRGEQIARDELQAGASFVNSFVKSDPRLPFGGINESGFGRELSHQGIKEFVNIKTIYVA